MANLMFIGILINSAFIGTIAWIIRGNCFQYANFSHVKEDEVLQGSSIATLPGKSTAECEAECVREYRCKSINIQIAGERHCELNSENVLDKMANLTLTSKAGWTYKATSYNETLLGVNCKYFKPCAVNDVCVDSCDCPGYICYRCRGINIGINCLANIVVEGTALGMENGKIKNYQITASSYNPNEKPHFARLNSENGWCAQSGKVDQNQFLKVDLIRRKIITDVAVQGFKNGDWVTKYRLEYTDDNISWQVYEEDGSNKTFDGTTSINAIVKQNLVYYIQAYSIKINPRVWVKWICMRIELYGIDDPWQPAIPKVLIGFPLGIEDRRVKDYQMSASSHLYYLQRALNGRLNAEGGWCAMNRAENEFIRVDFTSRKIITDIHVQSHEPFAARVSSYLLLYTEDSYDWKTYQVNGVDKLFDGPTAQNTGKKQTLPYWIRAFAIKINAKAWYNYICLRLEIYGIEDPIQPPIPAGCSKNAMPLGLASNQLPDSSLTASGYFNNDLKAKNARLRGFKEWCAPGAANPAETFIQVDLGKKMVVVAVAIQGRYLYFAWMKSFYISYGDTNGYSTWIMQGNAKKLFPGSVDRNGIVKNKFDPPIQARYVRIYPVASHNLICLRMELYGCDMV